VELHRELPPFAGQLSYHWEQIAGFPVTLANEDSPTASFVAPWRATESEFTFRVTVSDGDFQFTDDVTVISDPVPIDVRFRLETVDLAGNPVESVEVGEQFRLKVFIEDVRAEAIGPFAGFMDVTYDPELIDVVSGPTFGDVFNLTPWPALLSSGQWDEVGSNTKSLTPLGPGEMQLFEGLFVAESAGTVLLESNPAERPIQSATLLYGIDTPIQSSRIEYGAIRLSVVEAAESQTGIQSVYGPDLDSGVDLSSTEQQEVTSCIAAISGSASPGIISEGFFAGSSTVTFEAFWSGDCPFSSLEVNVTNTVNQGMDNDGYTIEPSVPQTITLQNNTPITYTVTAPPDPDGVGELIIFDVTPMNAALGISNATAEVSIIDTMQYVPAELILGQTANQSCSCSCTVCAADGVQVDPATATARVSLGGSNGYLPELYTEGPQNLHPFASTVLQFPAGQTTFPDEVKATLYAIGDGGTRVAIVGPYTYALDMVDNGNGDGYFRPTDKIGFTMQADLTEAVNTWALGEFSTYNLVLEAEGLVGSNETGQKWMATGSHLARNPEDSYLAPGWTFPFLTQLVLDQSAMDGSGNSRPGIGIIRGDNTASWYAGGVTPPESLSELTESGSGTNKTYMLTHRYGDKDVFDFEGRQIKSVDRNGNETLYGYDAQHRLSSVTDPYQHATNFAYLTTTDPDDVLMEVTDFAGRKTKFHYLSGIGELTLTYPDPDGDSGPLDSLITTFNYSIANKEWTSMESLDGDTTAVQKTALSYVNHRLLSVDRYEGAQIASSVKLLSHSLRDASPAFETGSIPESSPTTLYRVSGEENLAGTVQVKDSNENLTTLNFDHRGRVTGMIDALQNYFSYDLLVDRDPISGAYIRDRGEIEQIIGPDPDNLPNGGRSPQTITLKYDASGNVISRTLPNQPESGLKET
jgi:YD repeat-containing protein